MTYDMVHLADNEWSNTIMREVAQEWFKAHPDCQFVEVREHAGWWLGFARTPFPGSVGIECIGSANDMAQFRHDRPRPARYSGNCFFRPMIRHDLREVTSLEDYKPLVPQMSPIGDKLEATV